MVLTTDGSHYGRVWDAIGGGRVELRRACYEVFGDWVAVEYSMGVECPQRFVPNEAQERIIKAVGSGARIVFSGCGNRTGKTIAGVNVLINETVGVQNEWFDSDWYSGAGRKQDKIFIIASDTDKVKDTGVLQVTLKKYLKYSGIDYTTLKDRAGYDSVYNFKNGCVWRIMTYNQDPEEYEGSQVWRYLLDEPPPEAIWRSVVSRMLSGARVLIVATPLSGCAHIYHDVVLREDGKNIIVCYGDIEDNCIQHGKRGYLEHSEIEFGISMMTDEERQARVHGKFLFLSGSVFKEFSDDAILEAPETDANLRATGGQIPPSWPRVMAFDPHDRICSFGLWVAVAPDDTYYVYDEFPRFEEVRDFYDQKTTPYNWTKTVEMLKKHEEQYGVASYRLIDPRGSTFTVDQEYNVFEFLTIKMDFRIRAARSTSGAFKTQLEAGHQLIKNRLTMKKLKVFSRCKHTIYMLQNYRYVDNSRRVGENKEANDDVETKYKHAPDCIRYICQDEPKYIEREHYLPEKKFDYQWLKKEIIDSPFAVMQ